MAPVKRQGESAPKAFSQRPLLSTNHLNESENDNYEAVFAPMKLSDKEVVHYVYTAVMSCVFYVCELRQHKSWLSFQLGIQTWMTVALHFFMSKVVCFKVHWNTPFINPMDLVVLRCLSVFDLEVSEQVLLSQQPRLKPDFMKHSTLMSVTRQHLWRNNNHLAMRHERRVSRNTFPFKNMSCLWSTTYQKCWAPYHKSGLKAQKVPTYKLYT